MTECRHFNLRKSVKNPGQFENLFKRNSCKCSLVHSGMHPFSVMLREKNETKGKAKAKAELLAALSPKAVQRFGHYCTIPMFLTFNLTADVAQVKVSIDQRGPVVEVLGHVVQPVGLHPFDPVVAVLDLQRNLDCVVLHVSVPDWWLVVQSQQLRSCWDATGKNIQSQKMGVCSWPVTLLGLTESRLGQVTAVYRPADSPGFTSFPFAVAQERCDLQLCHNRKEISKPFTVTGNDSTSHMTDHHFLSSDRLLCFSLLRLPVRSIPLEPACVLGVVHF